MSTELAIALCALGTALVGAMAIVWRGGQLSQQLENARALAENLSEELQGVRQEFKDEVNALSAKIDGLTRMVFELKGARNRKGGSDD